MSSLICVLLENDVRDVLLNGLLCTAIQANMRSSCDPNPCGNGGVCVGEGSRYKCACAEGYAGANCETCKLLHVAQQITIHMGLYCIFCILEIYIYMKQGNL